MDEILDEVWTLLDSGANAGAQRSPFTMLQAATHGLDGTPAVRTVVLRRTCRAQRSLMFHTDLRSTKVAELRRDARIALIGCDMDAGKQLRLTGTARIVEDPRDTRPVWEASRPRTLIVYRAPVAPGTPVSTPAEAHPDPATTDGFEHFCLIEIAVSGIDYLHLAPEGHVRARFHFDAGSWRGQWLAP
ncbi:pyridoxamine 5'-phosphate oxidase family protein [Caballeronia sp. LZ043]|uniref:pyridoxamine 5'-phosphate oxidase family protein n=1 Tax=Caballeronia sp. LZ043 TaxID=3038569 RepID=UPI002865DF21|nr:pyridoxamine 5'-phosphate oxidase family protein [Caballeronia sp. LZ043]MDR5820723.1 pyridoxamine 5'-phosphate oxidase family protein [Caballeronia sp. LZ043]